MILRFNCDNVAVLYLWAPAGLGVAHAPILDEGTIAAAPVGSADGTDHELQHTFLDFHVVVTGLHKRNGIFPPLAAGEVAKCSLIQENRGEGQGASHIRSGICSSPSTEQLKPLWKVHQEGGVYRT